MGKRTLWRKNPNTTYAFFLRAKNVMGEISAWSDPPARINTDPVPPLLPPTKVEAWPLPLLNQIMIFWSNAKIEQQRRDIVAYRVYRTTHSVAENVTSSDEIADVKGLFHVDYSKDFKGVATASTTGSTLKFSKGTFRPTMENERILNMGTFLSPKSSYGTVHYVNSTTITASLSGGDTWEVGDRFIIDYVPRRNTQYYYWVASVSQEGRESVKSSCDGAKLGKPNDAVIDSFEEDESEDFLWLKGWSMTFHCPDGAEGYYLKWKRKNALFWSAPVYVPHEGEPDDPQTYVFKNKVVGKEYVFAVKAVNHLMYRDYWQDEFTEASDFVEDSGSPQPPENLKLYQGPFNNWIAWKQSESNDVKDYQIYRKQRTLGGGVPSTPTGSELLHPYVASWPSASSFFIDPLSGAMDRKNWYYWMRSRDWYNNKSSLAGPVGEIDSLPMIVPTEEQLLFGVKLTWNDVSGAAYYKIYRSWTNDSNTATCIAPFWFATTYIDLLRVSQNCYYWVNAVSNNGIETLFSGTGVSGTPGKPDVNTDTVGTLPESRLELNYDTIYLNSKISTKISAGDVNGIISTLTITPKNITLQSGGDITLSSGGSINIPNSADIVFDSARFYFEIDSFYIAPDTTGRKLGIGQGVNRRWDLMSFHSNRYVFWAVSQGFEIYTSNTADSQILLNLPFTGNGSSKDQFSIWIDPSTNDGSGNYTVKAKWIKD